MGRSDVRAEAVEGGELLLERGKDGLRAGRLRRGRVMVWQRSNPT